MVTETLEIWVHYLLHKWAWWDKITNSGFVLNCLKQTKSTSPLQNWPPSHVGNSVLYLLKLSSSFQNINHQQKNTASCTLHCMYLAMRKAKGRSGPAFQSTSNLTLCTQAKQQLSAFKHPPTTFACPNSCVTQWLLITPLPHAKDYLTAG